MFNNCYNLKSLNLSNFNTEQVTIMQSMFYNCSNLESLDLSNFNTEKVTNMITIFYGCTKLKSLDISNFNLNSLTSYDKMFFNTNLSYIIMCNLKDDDNKISTILGDYKNYICQCNENSNKILNAILRCCKYDFNFEKNDCELLSYIILYFKGSSGLDYQTNDKVFNSYNSRNVDFIVINNNYSNPIQGSEGFTILASDNDIVLEIYFNDEPVSSKINDICILKFL